MKFDFTNKSPGEIQEILETSADIVQYESYGKPLTAKDVDQFKETLAREQIEYLLLKKKKKEAMDGFRLQFKNKDEIIKEAAHAAHYKEIETEGNLYQMREQSEGQVYYYSEDGTFIKKRAIRPEERQLTINSELKSIGG